MLKGDKVKEKLVTLTEESLPVPVDHDATARDLKVIRELTKISQNLETKLTLLLKTISVQLFVELKFLTLYPAHFLTK